MPSSNKQRGNSGERKIATLLTSTFELPFARAPTSGAMVGGINSKRKDSLDKSQIKLFSGDIIAPEQFDLTIEVKKYKKFPFHLLFTGNCKLLDSWIKQVKNDAKSGNWILFFDIDYQGTYIAIDADFAKRLALQNQHYYRDIVIAEAKTFLADNKKQLQNFWANRHI